MAKYDLQDEAAPAGKYDLQNEAPANPVAAMGSTPDSPGTADIFGGGVQGNFDRFRSSFGDAPGKSRMLKEKGFAASQLNKWGELVGQSPNDKKWYKDQEGFKNPINWLEGHAGGAAPTLGMGLGGAIGSIKGYKGAVAGAGAGGGLGEGIRASIGKLMGTNDGDISHQMKEEALNSATGEAIGRPLTHVIGMIPGVKPAANWLADKTIRPALSGLSHITSLGAVDTGAAKRLLQDPEAVMNAANDANTFKAGNDAAREIQLTKKEVGAEASKVQQAVRDTYKGQRIDTNYVMNALDAAKERYKPNKLGVGPLGDANETKQSLKMLDKWQDLLVKGDGENQDQTFRSLQKTAKYLENYGSDAQNQTGSDTFKTDKLQGIAKHIAGSIKDDLHQMSPELEASDAKVTALARASDLLKGFENPSSAQQKAATLFSGANKTATQNAVKKYLPESAENLLNIGANKSFGKGDVFPMVGGPSAKGAVLGGLLAGAGGWGAGFSSHPLAAITAAGLGTGTLLSSPLIQKQLLNMSGRMINGQLPSMAIKSLGPWSLLNNKEKQ